MLPNGWRRVTSSAYGSFGMDATRALESQDSRLRMGRTRANLSCAGAVTARLSHLTHARRVKPERFGAD